MSFLGVPVIERKDDLSNFANHQDGFVVSDGVVELSALFELSEQVLERKLHVKFIIETFEFSIPLDYDL